MPTRIELFKAAEGKEFKAGTVIFSQGDERDNLYIVQSGDIEIHDSAGHIRTVGEGEIFGEMALITNSPRSATAVVHTDARLVPISAKRFLFLIDNNRDFALSIMRVLVERLVNPREDETHTADS
jgi:CRP/FNR family cyclic AMP-dependent transcriptional regulator